MNLAQWHIRGTPKNKEAMKKTKADKEPLTQEENKLKAHEGY